MRYLTRAIISSFFPRVRMQPRGTQILLGLAGGTVLILIGIMWYRLAGSSAPTLPEELDLKPLCTTDSKGDRWMIEPAAGQPFARLRERQEAPGPPLLVRTDMQREGGNQVSFGLTIEGQKGERYSPAITRNGVLLPAPGFTIVNEAGRTICKGRFKYG